MPTRLLSLVPLLSLAMPLLGQAPTPVAPPFDPLPLLAEVRGLQPDDAGGLHGFGADYQVRFLANGFLFQPMLGKAAPHDLPLALEVTHAGRGQLSAVGPATRAHTGFAVDYVRPELRERLVVRSDGLKQSFLFDRLPAGSGDLVVRTRLTTELQPERAASDRELRFLWPGAGGVAIGQVLGIDARGRTATGLLRTDGTSLDFVLPAAFVAAAALPLELDPLFGTVMAISNNAADERQVDIAHFPAPVSLFAVAYRRFVSATNNDVFVTFFNQSGTITSTVQVENAVNVQADNPHVVVSASAGNGLVFWEHGGDLSGRLLVPNGSGNSVVIANTANVETSGTAIGGVRQGNGRVFVAWLDDTGDAILGREVDVSANPPNALATQTLLTDAGLFTQISNPTLARTSASTNALLLYTSTSSVTGDIALRGLFVNSATPAAALGASFFVAGSSNTDVTLPAVAGDGQSWVAAFRLSNSITGDSAACAPIHRSGSTNVVGAARSLVGNGTTVNDLDAAWCGESALIAMARANGAANDVVLVSVDPLNCSDCEATVVVDSAGNGGSVAVAATGAQAALAWVPLSGTQGNVAAQRFTASDGTVAAVGSGPFGANFTAGCPRAGRADFGIELHGGPGNVPAFALVATQRLDLGCGGGSTLVPDLFGGFVVALGNTSAAGDVRLQFAIPSGVFGIALFAQFARLGTTCFSSFDLSSALQINIL
jgi:hypothetical protein